MGVNSLPKTVTRQRRDCDLNPGPSVPESSMLTTQLSSHPNHSKKICNHENSVGITNDERYIATVNLPPSPSPNDQIVQPSADRTRVCRLPHDT